MHTGAEALLRGRFLGGLAADGDAGVGLVGLGDAALGDRDAQSGGGGDAAVVGGAQSGRCGLGSGVEALGDGGGVSRGGFGGLHDSLLQSCAVHLHSVQCSAVNTGKPHSKLIAITVMTGHMRFLIEGRKKTADVPG